MKRPPTLKTEYCVYQKRVVYPSDVMEWLSRHSYDYYGGNIKKEDIPPELLKEQHES